MKIPLGKFIDSLMTIYRLPYRGVIHVGAHLGQEVQDYINYGFEHIRLVEPQPEIAERLSQMWQNDEHDIEIFQVACGSNTGNATLNLLKNTQLASMQTPIRASKDYDVVGTVDVMVMQLKYLINDRYNVVVIDAQGSEFDVLEGYSDDDTLIDLFIIEARNGGRYVGATNVPETIKFMCDRGWCHVGSLPHGPEDKANVFDLAFIRNDDNDE